MVGEGGVVGEAVGGCSKGGGGVHDKVELSELVCKSTFSKKKRTEYREGGRSRVRVVYL